MSDSATNARVWLPALLLAVALSAAAGAAAEPSSSASPGAPAGASSTAARWGAETLAKIRSSFYMPDRSLYAEEINDGKPPRPAWVWDASIQLGALCAAARLEPRTYLPQVKAYASALRAYRTTY